MKTKHQHKYRKVGMTLYCTCGLSTNIVCAHRWVFDKNVPIQIPKEGGYIDQRIEYYHCKNCGAVRMTNIISGVTTITK